MNNIGKKRMARKVAASMSPITPVPMRCLVPRTTATEKCARARPPHCPASTIRARWQDVDGKVHEEEMEGLMATCLQHEMDHLEGILFIDHLSRLKRQMVLKKLEKQRKVAA